MSGSLPSPLLTMLIPGWSHFSSLCSGVFSSLPIALQAVSLASLTRMVTDDIHCHQNCLPETWPVHLPCSKVDFLSLRNYTQFVHVPLKAAPELEHRPSSCQSSLPDAKLSDVKNLLSKKKNPPCLLICTSYLHFSSHFVTFSKAHFSEYDLSY